MPAPVFIGDEVTAAGYRLAGARIRVCDPSEAGEELTAALERSSLILVGAAHAAAVPTRQLQAALLAPSPPVIVVGSATGDATMPDVGAQARRDLGVEP